jgi:hypothetical protein
MKRTLLLSVLALLLAVGLGGAVAQDVTDISNDHGLDTKEAIQQWESQGYAEGDVERYQISLAIADERGDVNATDAVMTDIRNDYLRINYKEDYPRTLRLLLPREYITPYNSETGSITTDHTAQLEPARNGEYMAVTVEVEGPADIVIPLNRDHAISYSLIERVDQRIEQVSGISPLDRNHNWQYMEPQDIEQGANRLNHSLENIAIQFDATPGEEEPTWINAPEGETAGAPLYILQLEGTDDISIVSTTDTPPEIRYRSKGTLPAKVRGWIGEATEIPGNIRDRIEDIIPF